MPGYSQPPDLGWLLQKHSFMLQLFIFGAGITTIPTIALYNHGSEAGTAASLLGVVNFTTASVVSIVYGFMNNQDTPGHWTLDWAVIRCFTFQPDTYYKTVESSGSKKRQLAKPFDALVLVGALEQRTRPSAPKSLQQVHTNADLLLAKALPKRLQLPGLCR